MNRQDRKRLVYIVHNCLHQLMQLAGYSAGKVLVSLALCWEWYCKNLCWGWGYITTTVAIVHVDATRSVMANIPGQKRALYYCFAAA